MNESELIQAARGGDEAAFEQLVRLHEKKIYNLCLRMCGSSEDAAEAAQDTFLALWRGLEGFREDAALSTWLYRLASNTCIDLLRRSKRTVDGISLDDEDVHLEVCDRAPTPEEHVEGRETQRLVREGVDEDYYKRIVNANFGAALRELNSFESIAVSMAEGRFQGYDPYRFPEIYDSITAADVLAFLRENVTRSHMALSVIAPKEEEA